MRSDQRFIGGNYYPKYQTRNRVARWLVAGFLSQFRELAATTEASSCFEVGCGEGFLTEELCALGIRVRGIDLCDEVVAEAQSQPCVQNGQAVLTQGDVFTAGQQDAAELVVCCEVLEHLQEPEEALRILSSLARPWLLLSVPREPVWRAMNMMRGKYLADFGNTPGHCRHWSRRAFIALVSRYVQIFDVRSPLPWIMLLCRNDL